MLACAQLAGLKQIITSKTFLEKARLKVDLLQADGIKFIFIEEVRAKLTVTKKLVAALGTRFAPKSLLRVRASIEDPAVILFTSGSEGAPKGVELSHRNILANIRQMLAVCDLQDWDRFFTALPLFHSFGLSVERCCR
jgi:acyl-[acyl-carrier-protein]-phospholipid O-acyltransferase/long-chain-fatty-acid--[acyl-carrier-protein] ligase